MNKKEMLELADHMEKVPRRAFEMRTYSNRSKTSRAVKATLSNRCGTTCCIAGEKILLDGGSVRYAKNSYLEDFFDASGKPIESPHGYAAKKLGLSDIEADGLFLDFDLATPKQAAAKIRRMVGVQS